MAGTTTLSIKLGIAGYQITVSSGGFIKLFIVNSGHDDPLFWDVDPPAMQAIRIRA
jgi:hypothetical protein